MPFFMCSMSKGGAQAQKVVVIFRLAIRFAPERWSPRKVPTEHFELRPNFFRLRNEDPLQHDPFLEF